MCVMSAAHEYTCGEPKQGKPDGVDVGTGFRFAKVQSNRGERHTVSNRHRNQSFDQTNRGEAMEQKVSSTKHKPRRKPWPKGMVTK